MDQPEVISRMERDGGYIETLDRPGMEIYYRSCARGYCRYSSDMWQAELYQSTHGLCPFCELHMKQHETRLLRTVRPPWTFGMT